MSAPALNGLNISGIGQGLRAYMSENARQQTVEEIAYEVGLPQYIESLNDFKQRLPAESLLITHVIDPKLTALQNLIGYNFGEAPRPGVEAVGALPAVAAQENRASARLLETLISYNSAGLGRQGVRDRLKLAIDEIHDYIVREVKKIFIRYPTSPSADVKLTGTMGQNLRDDMAQVSNMAMAPPDPENFKDKAHK